MPSGMGYLRYRMRPGNFRLCSKGLSKCSRLPPKVTSPDRGLNYRVVKDMQASQA